MAQVAPRASEEFSLVLGGPLFQLFRRMALCDDSFMLLRRRVLALAAVAWLPLLALSAWDGDLWGGTIRVPFLKDVAAQLRFLIVLPLLIISESVAHKRLQPVAQRFLEQGLIPAGARQQFDAAIASARRLRNSPWAEALLLALVYGVGVLFFWRREAALELSGWYGVTVGGRLQPSPAGWWMGLVSLPLLQFLLLRWYFRQFIWARLLWQVSRVQLDIMPAHPDRAGGLGFLAPVSYVFAPLMLAQGTLLAGLMANRIIFAGATLAQFKVECIGVATVMLLLVLGPLLVFYPQLARAKRAGLREFSMLGQRYVREFDQKWGRGAKQDEPLVGSADIQSLADLGNSFEVVKGMRPVPFNLQSILQVAVFTLLPCCPLILTMISLEDLLKRLLKIVF
jgi:hypothetical protein